MPDKPDWKDGKSYPQSLTDRDLDFPQTVKALQWERAVQPPKVDVQQFHTGAIREAKEERYDLIPPEPIRLLAVHYARGATKYAERNWEKGIPWSNLYNSARRHMDKWLAGEDIDPDPIMRAHHLVAAIWNLVGLVDYATTHPELDDRPKKKEA
jgi:hypothetical protein